MDKENFLKELEIKLKNNKINDYEAYQQFYSELLDDNMDEGKTLEDSIRGIGGIDSIIKSIKNEEEISGNHIPLTEIKWLNILLILAGAPFWAPILLVVLTLILTFYLLIWCLPIVLSGLSLVSIAIGTISLVGVPFNKEVYYMISQTGFSFIILGLGLVFLILTINVVRKFTILTRKFTGKILLFFKNRGIEEL